MRRLTINMAGFAGIALGIAFVTVFVVHIQGEAESTGKKTIPPTIVAAVTRVHVPPAPLNDSANPAVSKITALHHVVQAPASATATLTHSTVTSTPAAPAGGSAWITLDNYAQTPGSWTVHVRGGGFAPQEAVDLSAQGAARTAPANLVADAQGNLDGSVSLQIPPDPNSTVDLHAQGVQSNRQATAGIGVVPYITTLSLVPYAAFPGQTVDVFVSSQGYPPNTPVRLQVGGKVIQTAHADGGGTLQAHATYIVPYTSVAAHLKVEAASSGGHAGATQTLDILALQPWAIASAYAVHAGDHVQFDAHGFAAGEPVKVYLGGGPYGPEHVANRRAGNRRWDWSLHGAVRRPTTQLYARRCPQRCPGDGGHHGRAVVPQYEETCMHVARQASTTLGQRWVDRLASNALLTDVATVLPPSCASPRYRGDTTP